MNISADLYRVFYQVGLHLSFSKAAKTMNVSQSAISQSVKQLERELGIALFVRTTKSVSFTPKGKELFEVVAQSFTMLDDVVQQLQERNAFELQSFRLAAGDTLCSHYLLPFFKKWQKENGDRGLRIVNRPSLQCVDMVRNHEVDAAVVTLNKDILEEPQLEVFELIPLTNIFIGGKKYKNYTFTTIEALLQEPLVLLEKGALSRDAFEKLLGKIHVAPDFELGSLGVLVSFLTNDMGISFAPREYVLEELASGALVEIKTNLSIPLRKVGLIRSRLFPMTVGTAKFIDLLTKE